MRFERLLILILLYFIPGNDSEDIKKGKLRGVELESTSAGCRPGRPGGAARDLSPPELRHLFPRRGRHDREK